MDAKSRGLLRGNIQSCSLCPISGLNSQPPHPPVPWLDRRTQLPADEQTGHKSGGLLVLGEAPDKSDLTRGEVFTGTSGKIIQQELRDVGLGGWCAFANVTCCIPTRVEPTFGMRPPNDQEMINCRTWLHHQIIAVDPQLILLTGATAVKAWRNDLKVTKIRGNSGKWWLSAQSQYPVFVTLHPAGILRKGGQWDRVNFKQDILDVATIILEGVSPECWAWNECVVCGETPGEIDRVFGVGANGDREYGGTWDRDGVYWCRRHWEGKGKGVAEREGKRWNKLRTTQGAML